MHPMSLKKKLYKLYFLARVDIGSVTIFNVTKSIRNYIALGWTFTT